MLDLFLREIDSNHMLNLNFGMKEDAKIEI